MNPNNIIVFPIYTFHVETIFLFGAGLMFTITTAVFGLPNMLHHTALILKWVARMVERAESEIRLFQGPAQYKRRVVPKKSPVMETKFKPAYHPSYIAPEGASDTPYDAETDAVYRANRNFYTSSYPGMTDAATTSTSTPSPDFIFRALTKAATLWDRLFRPQR